MRNTVCNTEKFQQALRHPKSSTFGTDEGLPQEILASYDTLEQYDGYAEMIAGCNLFVKSCHCIHGDAKKNEELMKNLSNCCDMVMSLDLELIHQCKTAARGLIAYFEEKDSEGVCWSVCCVHCIALFFSLMF